MKKSRLRTFRIFGYKIRMFAHVSAEKIVPRRHTALARAMYEIGLWSRS